MKILSMTNFTVRSEQRGFQQNGFYLLRVSKTFLPEGYKSYYIAVRGPDILRIVICCYVIVMSLICCILPNQQIFRKYNIF